MKENQKKELCEKCGLYNVLCICNQIEKISLKNKVSVIIPDVESKKISNTGGLVKATLTNSEVFIRGKKNELFNPDNVLDDNYQNIILYTGGRELSYDLIKSFDKPVNLIVPDGTWTTAPKIVTREPKFYSIPKVSLIKPPLSQYRIRKHPNPYCISTFEAILYALEIIENNPEISRDLLRYFLMKIDRVLWLGGKMKSSEVSGILSQRAIDWKKGIN